MDTENVSESNRTNLNLWLGRKNKAIVFQRDTWYAKWIFLIRDTCKTALDLVEIKAFCWTDGNLYSKPV